MLELDKARFAAKYFRTLTFADVLCSAHESHWKRGEVHP